MPTGLFGSRRLGALDFALALASVTPAHSRVVLWLAPCALRRSDSNLSFSDSFADSVPPSCYEVLVSKLRKNSARSCETSDGRFLEAKFLTKLPPSSANSRMVHLTSMTGCFGDLNYYSVINRTR